MMTLDDFRENVEPVILMRGEDYYARGNVVRLDRHGNEWKAVVSGAKDYDVRVRIGDERQILESECNCPYDFGDVCKHEVAVYLAISKKLREKDEPAGAQEDFEADLDRILSSLDKEALLRLLKEQAKCDPIFRSMLIAEHNKSLKSLESCRRIVSMTINAAKTPNGIIPV